MRPTALLAALLALTALGCSTHDGTGPAPTLPTECDGSANAPDAVADDWSWRWCDGREGLGICAEDFDAGTVVSICSDISCRQYVATPRGWVDRWTGDLVAECFAAEASLTLTVF